MCSSSHDLPSDIINNVLQEIKGDDLLSSCNAIDLRNEYAQNFFLQK